MKEVQEDRATASAGTGRHLGCAGFCKNRLTPLLPLIVPAEPPPCLPALPLPPTGAASPEPPGYPFPGEDRAPPSTTATSTAGTEPGPGAAAAPALPSSGCCPLPAAIIPPSAAPAAHPSLRQQATGFGFASQSGGSKPSPPPPPLPELPAGFFEADAKPPPPPPAPCSYCIPSHSSPATGAVSGSPQATQKSTYALPGTGDILKSILCRGPGCSESRRLLRSSGTASRRGQIPTPAQAGSGEGGQALLP